MIAAQFVRWLLGVGHLAFWIADWHNAELLRWFVDLPLLLLLLLLLVVAFVIWGLSFQKAQDTPPKYPEGYVVRVVCESLEVVPIKDWTHCGPVPELWTWRIQSQQMALTCYRLQLSLVQRRVNKVLDSDWDSCASFDSYLPAWPHEEL